MKTCSKCRLSKPLDAFWRSARSADGRLPRCRECEKKYVEKNAARVRATSKAYRERNPEKRSATWRRWAEQNVEHREEYRRSRRASEQFAEWYAATAEQRRAYFRRWRELNREQRRAYVREWRARDPEARKPAQMAAKANRRARAAANGGRCSASELRQLLVSQNGLCTYCGDDLAHGKHLDHKTPLARGGDSSIGNLQYLCPSCNLAKGTLTDEEFVRATAMRDVA